MRGLQGRIALVLRVPRPVVGQRDELVEVRRLRRRVVAVGEAAVRVVLVDVVAEVQHDVEVLSGHAGVGRPVAVLEVLAVDDGEAQGAAVLPRPRGGLRAAGGAEGAEGAEAVGVLAAGLQAARVDVHGVRELGLRVRRAGADHLAEPVVEGDLPLDLDRLVRQARAQQAGPQDDAVG
nr:hypothetical protein GCM10020063_022660 [Dactylosporangium thailandense]